MSRSIRHARPKKAIARQLILEAAVFLGLILLVAIALPIYFGADPSLVAR